MKYLIILSISISILLVPLITEGQTPVDLENRMGGQWVFEKVKSPFAKENYLNETLDLVVSSGELQFVRTWTEKGSVVRLSYTLYSDGRGETNTERFGKVDVKRKSKTKWKKGKLVREISATSDNTVFGQTENYEISEDGKYLTLSMINQSATGPTFNSGFGSPIVITYKRKEP